MRLPDWEQRLSDFIADNMTKPFAWGEHDCALFGTACAAELTGTDEAAIFRGKYSTREGSALALRQYGKGTLLKTLDDLYQRKPVAFAQRGDLVWSAGAVGVCDGAKAWFVGQDGDFEGLVTVPRREWTKAWAI
jgi:hypothetical protein